MDDLLELCSLSQALHPPLSLTVFEMAEHQLTQPSHPLHPKDPAHNQDQADPLLTAYLIRRKAILSPQMREMPT